MGLGPLPSIPNMLKVVIRGVVDEALGYPWANVLHFAYSGTAPSNSTCATIASDVATQWASHMAPECPSPTELTSVTVTDLTSPTSGEGEWLGSNAGSRGDDSIPANAAVLITYPAASRYKGGHPRQYLYVLGNADLTGAAEWTSTATTEVQTHWQAFLTAVESLSVAGTALTSFNSIRYYGKFLPNSGPPRYRLTTPVVNPITISEAIAHQEIASQRGRVGRRKR
jgi:hypothetical protein